MVSMEGAPNAKWTIVAWNDLGMHCVDGNDYSVFSILPPYNNIHAQVIDNTGKLVKSSTGLTITYQAVADPTGSINRTSYGKTNFWQYALPLFGVSLSPDVGLAGNAMPGKANKPQGTAFDAKYDWFIAQGVPILPYDDANIKNYYPLMKIVAKSGMKVVASTNIVLPVSDEIDCTVCHGSGSVSAATLPMPWERRDTAEFRSSQRRSTART